MRARHFERRRCDNKGVIVYGCERELAGTTPPPFVFSASVRASSLFGVCVRPARTFRPFLIQMKKYILAPGSQAAMAGTYRMHTTLRLLFERSVVVASSDR